MVSRFRPLILVLGVGEMSSAVAHRLFKARFRVVMTEEAFELELHRFTTFSRIFTDGVCEVEGVAARAAVVTEALGLIERGSLPVLAVDARSAVDALNPEIVVDARETRRPASTGDDFRSVSVGDAPFVIAAHRDFSVGEDCDMAVVVQKGLHLGRPVANAFEGLQILPQVMSAPAQDRQVAEICTPCAGVFTSSGRLGAAVAAGDAVGQVNGRSIAAEGPGILKGILAPGARVEIGTVVAELECSGVEDMVYVISDRARAVSGTILEMAVSWAVDTGDLTPRIPYERGP